MRNLTKGVVLYALMVVLSGCGNRQVKQDVDPLWCPEEAFNVPDKQLPPTSTDFSEFKKWAGKGYADRLRLDTSYSILKQCWDREAAKRIN